MLTWVKILDYICAGLSLVLFVEPLETLRFIQRKRGVRLLVHLPDELPLLVDKGYDIEPGQWAFHKLTKVPTFYNLLECMS